MSSHPLNTVPKRPAAVQAESRGRVSAPAGDPLLAKAAALAVGAKRALHATLHQSTRGLKAIADYAGVSYSFLANSAITSSQNQLPFSRLPLVLEACSDLTLVQFLADRQGALVTRRPTARRATTSDVRETAAAMREFAAFVEAAAAADAAGHAVHPSELARLDARGREVLASIAQLLADYRGRVPRPLLEGL